MLQLPEQEPIKLAKPKGDEQQRIRKMRMAMVMGSPFWGLTSMKMLLVAKPECGTAATDGRHFFYNPAYIAALTDAKVRGLTAHETGHNVMGHVWRRGTRMHRLWNIACDYALDQMLDAQGFDVPNKLVNPEWKGKSAEEIYSLLLQELEQEARDRNSQQGGSGQGESGEGQGEGGQGKPQPGKGKGKGGPVTLEDLLDEKFGEGPTKGEVLDAPTESAIQDQAEWKQAVAAAAEVAKGHGNLPADLQALITEVITPRIDWKAYMRRFVQVCAKLDFNWSQPSPRYAASGLYLPRLRSEQLPPIVVFGDTSGSTADEQGAYYAELGAVLEEARPECIHFVQVDAQVQDVRELQPGDPIQQTVKGYGGTDFRPAFAWVEEQGIEPACAIYFTDMYGTFPEEEPPYPVLWVSTTPVKRLEGTRYMPPFGEVVYLDLE